jgi:hypothetical protein
MSAVKDTTDELESMSRWEASYGSRFQPR